MSNKSAIKQKPKAVVERPANDLFVQAGKDTVQFVKEVPAPSETKTSVKHESFEEFFKQGKTTKRETPKLEIVLPENQFPGISDKLLRREQLNNMINEMETEKKLLDGEFVAIGRDEFSEMMERTKARPDSFILRGKRGGAIEVIPMDKYLKIDDARVAELNLKYPDIAEKKMQYSINEAMFSKYDSVILDLIKNCAHIDSKDKPFIFEFKKTAAIKKGVINNLHTYGKVAEVLAEVQPIFSLKNCR